MRSISARNLFKMKVAEMTIRSNFVGNSSKIAILWDPLPKWKLQRWEQSNSASFQMDLAEMRTSQVCETSVKNGTCRFENKAIPRGFQDGSWRDENKAILFVYENSVQKGVEEIKAKHFCRKPFQNGSWRDDYKAISWQFLQKLRTCRGENKAISWDPFPKSKLQRREQSNSVRLPPKITLRSVRKSRGEWECGRRSGEERRGVERV